MSFLSVTLSKWKQHCLDVLASMSGENTSSLKNISQLAISSGFITEVSKIGVSSIQGYQHVIVLDAVTVGLIIDVRTILDTYEKI